MFGLSKATRDAEFTAFVAQASDALVRVGIGLTGTGEGARELVQASLVKTYVAWPKIRHDDAYAYARRIMANHRIDQWRATRKEFTSDEVPDSPSTDGQRVEDRAELVQLLGALPARQRAVVVLRYYEDLSEHEVAEILGISVGAVKSAASRGLAALRSHHDSEAGAR